MEMELWKHGGGFSLDATVRIAASDGQGLELLMLYCAIPPCPQWLLSDSSLSFAWKSGASPFGRQRTFEVAAFHTSFITHDVPRNTKGHFVFCDDCDDLSPKARRSAEIQARLTTARIQEEYAPMARTPANPIAIKHEAFGEPAAPPVLLIMGLGGQLFHWDEAFCRLVAELGRYAFASITAMLVSRQSSTTCMPQIHVSLPSHGLSDDRFPPRIPWTTWRMMPSSCWTGWGSWRRMSWGPRWVE
jgi:hypothetical protein